MTAHDKITVRLLRGGVAGPHCSHSREDNVAKASQLADMFAENFKKYESGVDEAVRAAGPSKVRV